MISEIDASLYSGLMVYIAKNHPDLYEKVQGQVPRRVRVILNNELGTNVSPADTFIAGIEVFMRVLRHRAANSTTSTLQVNAETMQHLFSEWYLSLEDGEPSIQQTFKAGYDAAKPFTQVVH